MERKAGRVTWTMRLLAVLITCQLSLITAMAQDDPEYRMEIGAGAGTVTYLGDYNGNLLRGLEPFGTVMAKYRMNPRSAVALGIGVGNLRGETANAGTKYPENYYQFNNSLVDVSLRYEYNFWPYGTGKEYRGAQRFTPFLILGVGATYHGGQESNATMSLPLGVGVKYKLGERLNLSAEWRVHFTLSDFLDNRKDPSTVSSKGIFKNTDGYSLLQVALSYDIWAKCKTCHNDRD